MSGAATFAHDHVSPAENDPSWRNNAACLGADSGVFFPDRGTNATEAKQICGGCPVQAECLEYALRTRPVYGIWGGLNHNERWDVIQGRRRRASVTNQTLPARKETSP